MNKNLLRVEKYEPEVEALLSEVLEGFSSRQKQLPCKLFYDKEGSSLFDEICTLDEYYLTRTERAIMKENIGAISNALGKNTLLIELRSGSSRKIRLLLDSIKNPAGYVPIDISEEHLVDSVKSLARDYPGLRIMPVYADYTQLVKFPDFEFPYSRKVVYYPGSTIGNFSPSAARRFMKSIAKWAGRESGLLIGVDLVKDKAVLERAYNDGKGVTAKFNLNILKRLNRETGMDFDLAKWEHYAYYNTDKNRIEMHLRSLAEQRVHVNGSLFSMKKGETILTEYSYKYTLKGFKELVSNFFAVEEVWTDVDMNFSVQYLRVL